MIYDILCCFGWLTNDRIVKETNTFSTANFNTLSTFTYGIVNNMRLKHTLLDLSFPYVCMCTDINISEIFSQFLMVLMVIITFHNVVDTLQSQ